MPANRGDEDDEWISFPDPECSRIPFRSFHEKIFFGWPALKMPNGCVGNFNDVKRDNNSSFYLRPAFLSRKSVGSGISILVISPIN